MSESKQAVKRRVHHRHVEIPAGDAVLRGDLSTLTDALGIVLFAHGSGSSRFSPRNRYVAEVLQEAQMATLLMDLLTPDEETIDNRTAQLRFDIPLLADRLVAATDWLKQTPDVGGLPLGLFGASTGGAAALVAAARRTETVAAVVSRGGRPDLAGEDLAGVCAPTLLIVGGNDTPVIELNREAMALLHTVMQLEIVPGATHLFEEPGALDRVAHLAADWFAQHFRQ